MSIEQPTTKAFKLRHWSIIGVVDSYGAVHSYQMKSYSDGSHDRCQKKWSLYAPT